MVHGQLASYTHRWGESGELMSMEGVDCGSVANSGGKHRAVRMRSRGVGDRRVRVWGCYELEWGYMTSVHACSIGAI